MTEGRSFFSAGRRSRGEQGLSLVEVLAALAILAFVVIGIAGLFTRSMTINASSFDYALLAAEGRRMLEDLESLPFDHPRLAATGRGPHHASVPGFEITYSVTDYRIDSAADVEGSVSWPRSEGGACNVKRVTVTVRALPKAGRLGRREFTVTALRVRR